MNNTEFNSTSSSGFGGKQNHVVTIARVAAMWMIIGCHISSWLAIPFLAQILNVGVYVFLLISGILYSKKTIPDGIRFFKQRWLKICFPMYYLVAFLIIFDIFYAKTEAFMSIPTYLLNLQGTEFIISWLHFSQIGGLGHLWFLTVIMLCYFLLIPVKKIEKNFVIVLYSFLLYF